MRFIPFIRFKDDDSPTAIWEWLFAPIVLPIIFALFVMLAVLSVPYFMLYPERHAHQWDFDGTDRQREILAKFRRIRSRCTVTQKILLWWQHRNRPQEQRRKKE